MDKQRDVRKHIAAAKGWLNKADDSLEQENDIQGDLKLMLAHAELQRAQEKNDQKLCVRWFKRLAPPLVACLLALAGILYSQAGKPEPLHEAPVADKLPLQAAPPEAQINNVQEKPDSPYSDKVQAVLPVPEQPQAEEKDMAAEEANNTDVPVSSQQEPEVPARELQQLMQSAGSILRE